MAVKYWTYGRQGNKVSTMWYTVLNRADNSVNFTINDGHRTFAEQQYHWDRYQAYLRGGPWAPVAARPSHNAPHIWTGRPNHALDVNTTDGGEQRLQNWLNSHRGVRARGKAVNNVGGEAWHLYLPLPSLVWLYYKYRRFRP